MTTTSDWPVEKILRYQEFRRGEATLTWSVEPNGSGGYLVKTPNRVEVCVDESIQWDQIPESQYQSTLLWLYSLVYLKKIVDEYDDLRFAAVLTKSFADFVRSNLGQERLATLTSRDHMTAEYVKTLTYLLTFPEFEAQEQARTLVSDGIKWAIEPGHIASNNHGMMLCVSILHGLRFIDTQDRDSIEEQSTQTLSEIVRNAFDSNGICTENSPAYHAFYIRFLNTVIEEAQILEGSYESLISELQELLSLAHEALATTALPDGKLPPLGDGNTSGAVIEATKEGTMFSPETGFYSHKSQGVYFSMKCGMATITHKHADDNSIFLWANGEQVIADAGLYNYDWKEPLTVSVKSQLGHSGPFFEKFDDYYPATLYRHDNVRVVGELTLGHSDDQMNQLVGRSTIDGQFTAIRKVSFLVPTSLEIFDSFEAPQGEPRVVRFLIPGNFSVEIAGSTLRATSSVNKLTLSFEHEHIQLTRGDRSGAVPKGWIADGFGSISPAWLVEVRLPDSRSSHTTRAELASVDTIPQKVAANSPPHTSSEGAAPMTGSLATITAQIEMLTSRLHRLEDSVQPKPSPATPGTWDKLVDPWVDLLPEHGDKIPSAYRIWQSSRRYLDADDPVRARRCEELNYLLHNSYVPSRLNLEGEIVFAYGGIGVIVHQDSHIRPGAVIGANVTVGGNGSSSRIDERTGKPTTVPEIGEFATLGAGVNVSGGIVVGPMAIIAPNTVVTKSVGAGEIVAGVPGRVIGRVTRENALRYKVKYLMARSWSDEEFLDMAYRLLPETTE